MFRSFCIFVFLVVQVDFFIPFVFLFSWTHRFLAVASVVADFVERSAYAFMGLDRPFL